MKNGGAVNCLFPLCPPIGRVAERAQQEWHVAGLGGVAHVEYNLDLWIEPASRDIENVGRDHGITMIED
jgi:hypothetical protein